jgi:hypothetical protein
MSRLDVSGVETSGSDTTVPIIYIRVHEK